MKVLVFAANTIGDNIGNILPVCRKLHAEGHQVDCLVSPPQIFNIFSGTPYFNKIIPIPYRSIRYLPQITDEAIKESANLFPLYDKVFSCFRGAYRRIKRLVDASLMGNIDTRIEADAEYDFMPVGIFNKFGFKYLPEDILINLEWYKSYYKDFNCSENSVLINTQSGCDARTYNKKEELKSILTTKGFEVIEMDFDVDIRYNLYLINQVKHILTVDTSTYWLGKCLGRSPHVFLHTEFSEVYLGVKNLVPWYETLDEIPAELIVECFLERINNGVSPRASIAY